MPPDLRLRRVVPEDRDLLLRWRNEPATRAASRQTEEVADDEHETWLAGVLGDPDLALLIAELDGGPIGQVRFDRARAYEYAISVSIDPDRRGQGLGRELIDAGCRWLWEHSHATAIVADIRADNHGSLRAFATAGFEPAGQADPGWTRHRLPRRDEWAPAQPPAAG